MENGNLFLTLNNNTMNLLVKFEQTIKVNEEEWRNVWVERLFDEFTTLNEIIEWAKMKQNVDKVPNYKLDVRGLIITEIEY